MAEAASTTSKTAGRVLDRSRHFVTVHGREEAPDTVAHPNAKAQVRRQASMQDGRYFDDEDHEILDLEPAAKLTDAEAKRRADDDAREIAHREELAKGVGKR